MLKFNTFYDADDVCEQFKQLFDQHSEISIDLCETLTGNTDYHVCIRGFGRVERLSYLSRTLSEQAMQNYRNLLPIDQCPHTFSELGTSTPLFPCSGS